MEYPTIHLNGTSKQELIDQLCDACNALNDAASAIANTRPNGRDYYVQDDRNFPKALEEHSRRINLLISVRNELMQIAEHIA